jgi:diguanylate cyclase (GGDEF)-like protein
LTAAIHCDERGAVPRIAGYLRRRLWLRGLAIASLSAAASAAIIKLTLAVLFGNDIAVCWPMVGITTAFLLRMPRREWPWVVAGLCLGQLYLERVYPPSEMLADTICNAAETLIAAFALPAFTGVAAWMKQPRLLLRFILWPILLGPALTAVPVGLVYARQLHESFWPYAARWYFGDALGIVLWLPLTTVLLSRETWSIFRPKALPGTAALLGLLALAAFALFSAKPSPTAFVLMPLLLLIALKRGFSASVLAVNLVTILVAGATVHGHGPFGSIEGQYRVMTLQVFLAFCMLMCFPISIILLEREEFDRNLKEAYRRVEQLAIEDALTGLANRRRFDTAIEQEWRRALRAGYPLGVLLIDVDCFKLYNDRYGHVAGDECLRRIAAAIATGAERAGDLVARYGGEEFVVLMPRTELPGLLKVAEWIRVQVSSIGLDHEDSPHGHVTISVGCSTVIPVSGLPPESLVESADQALYSAKKNGRNRVAAFTRSTDLP